MRRIVPPIKSAGFLVEPPAFTKRKKLNRAQSRGLTYERRVVAELAGMDLGTLMAGPWIEFRDHHGSSICQPDALIIGAQSVLVVEAKLKQSTRGIVQLSSLYGPLCGAMWPDRRVLLLQVFRFPKWDKSSRWVDGPKDLLDHPRDGVHYWHLFK